MPVFGARAKVDEHDDKHPRRADFYVRGVDIGPHRYMPYSYGAVTHGYRLERQEYKKNCKFRLVKLDWVNGDEVVKEY